MPLRKLFSDKKKHNFIRMLRCDHPDTYLHHHLQIRHIFVLEVQEVYKKVNKQMKLKLWSSCKEQQDEENCWDKKHNNFNSFTTGHWHKLKNNHSKRTKYDTLKNLFRTRELDCVYNMYITFTNNREHCVR
jgi:hypothetical protein